MEPMDTSALSTRSEVMLAINHLIACGWYGVAYWTRILMSNWFRVSLRVHVPCSIYFGPKVPILGRTTLRPMYIHMRTWTLRGSGFLGL